MINLTSDLSELDGERINSVNVDELLAKKIYTLNDIIDLLNTIVDKCNNNLLISCQISSENHINFSNNDIFFKLPIDSDWDLPKIEIGKYIIWHTQQNEKIITINRLSEKLIAIYTCSSYDFSLTIMSKKVYDNHSISEEITTLLVNILAGDIDLVKEKKYFLETEFFHIIDYLVESGNVFVIDKKTVKNIDYITEVPYIDWNRPEKYSVEYTKEGRLCFLNHTLHIKLMEFIRKTWR